MDTIQCASCGENVDTEAAACPSCGADPHTGRAEPVKPAFAPALAPRKAAPPYVPRHTVRRGIAGVIDWAPLGVVGILVWNATVNTSGATYSGGNLLWRFLALPAIVAGILFVYGSALESVRGATVGKLFVGVRARMLDGARCTVGSALLRNVSKAVVGAAMVMFPLGVSGLIQWFQARGTGTVEIYWSRLLALLLSGPICLLLTFALMMASPLRRRLGDRLAGTVVVRRKAAYPAPAETADAAIAQGR